jgi:hypothetical protein
MAVFIRIRWRRSHESTIAGRYELAADEDADTL